MSLIGRLTSMRRGRAPAQKKNSYFPAVCEQAHQENPRLFNPAGVGGPIYQRQMELLRALILERSVEQYAAEWDHPIAINVLSRLTPETAVRQLAEAYGKEKGIGEQEAGLLARDDQDVIARAVDRCLGEGHAR